MATSYLIRRSVKRLVAVLLLLAAAAGCAVNPVTGERELTLVSEASELQIGQQNYAPMQQAQGGRYDVDPELSRYVNEVGQRLAEVSDRPLPYEFVVLNNSVPNAWALPGGKIAINRGLLTELQSEAELAAVLGHEIVHAAARHSARQMERGMLLQGLILATGIATSDSSYQGLIVGGAGVGAQLINQAYGRDAELEADRYGMEYMSRAGYDPQGAVTLQQTFVRLSEGRETDWLSGLFASHPPSQQRVEANQRIAASLPPGGELGVERYQDRLAETREVLPAYQAYDEGRKALAENDIRTADVRAETAIGLFPREAHFYSLRGDARLMQKQYDEATGQYGEAIERREDFFYYHLQRGRTHAQLGNDDQAVTDLERSLTLLETAPAHYILGTIAEKRGNLDKATAHYKAASGGNDQIANAARNHLVRLDLPNNADAYVSRRCDAASNGNLVVSVRNDTNLRMRDITVTVGFTAQDGRARTLERRVRGTLDPGAIASIDTGLGPYQPGTPCPATVTYARVAQ